MLPSKYSLAEIHKLENRIQKLQEEIDNLKNTISVIYSELEMERRMRWLKE
jgi:peptidoglycan hydrolase CwlO-like protein